MNIPSFVYAPTATFFYVVLLSSIASFFLWNLAAKRG